MAKVNVREQDLTAAPMELTLLDGNVIKLHPLTDKDVAELDNYVRSEYMSRVRGTFNSEMSSEERAEELGIAQQTAIGLKWTMQLGRTLIGRDMQGFARFVQQQALKTQPNIRLDYLIEQLASEDKIEEVYEVFKYLNGLDNSTVQDGEGITEAQEKKGA